MAISSQIDSENNLIVRTITDKLSMQEILDSFNASLADKAFNKDMHVIWDLRNANISELSSEEIIKVVEFIQSSTAERGSEYKIALVASEDSNFGISRMFATYGQELPLSIGVYRDIDEAYDWVNTPL